MAFAFILPIRLAQAVLAFIILCLLAFAANQWSWWSPSQINFLILASVWTLLAILYLVLSSSRYPAAAHKLGILAAEAVTMIFWFAGFIALAQLLTVVGCSGRYGGVCAATVAGDIFAAFEWLLFTATTIMSVLHSWSTRNERSGKHDLAMGVQA